MTSVVNASSSGVAPRISVPATGLPPGPTTPALAQTWRYTRNPLPFLDECGRAFGDMFTLRLAGLGAWVFVCSPPLLKKMFTIPADVAHAGEANASVFSPVAGPSTVFTMDETSHLNRRRLLLPQFTAIACRCISTRFGISLPVLSEDGRADRSFRYTPRCSASR